MNKLVFSGLLWITGVVSIAGAAAADDRSQRVQDFTLGSNYGNEVSLSDFADKPVIVLAFLGTECPLAKLYGPRLSAMQASFAEQGVAFIGVSSNKQDSLTKLTAYVHRYEINFPMLKDVGNRLADELGAARTPEVVVLDSQRKIRYRGRIDDQYGVGFARDKAQRADLQLSIEEVLADKLVTIPETIAVGCHIGRVKELEPKGDITFTKHIAPILNARCVTCHREGEIGPFTLTKYSDLLGWEETILEVVAENRMPPWNANPAHGEFKNDARLSQSERDLLKQWVAGGMPEGDPADLPAPPEFTEGWRIPEPDQVFSMRDKPFEVPAEGIVDYQRYVVDPGWTEDKFISAAEARPGNRQVVHHILVYIIPPGKDRIDLEQILVGYAPGSLPVLCDEGVALKVKAGSKLLFEMHYTPNGSKQSDLSYAGVCFVDESQVQRVLQGRAAVEPRLKIPAGASDHEVVAKDYVIRKDELLQSMTPHMHLRGKAFRFEAFYPNGTREILLDVPNYDFNWQLKYILAEPKLLPKGTKIRCTAVYDNSHNNLSNPDPKIEVIWGQQSSEEMMIGFFDTLPAN